MVRESDNMLLYVSITDLSRNVVQAVSGECRSVPLSILSSASTSMKSSEASRCWTEDTWLSPYLFAKEDRNLGTDSRKLGLEGVRGQKSCDIWAASSFLFPCC